MELLLKRTYNNTAKGYCIGHLYIDGKYYMDVLEDTDRGLDQKMTLKEIINRKLKGITAIPTGIYRVVMNIMSPKYSKKKFFYNLCRGYMPRLLGVKGYEGILIHPGNLPKDTDGCLLVGFNKVKGGLVDSTKCFVKLYDMLKKANDNNEEITIEIIRKY